MAPQQSTLSKSAAAVSALAGVAALTQSGAFVAQQPNSPTTASLRGAAPTATTPSAQAAAGSRSGWSSASGVAAAAAGVAGLLGASRPNRRSGQGKGKAKFVGVEQPRLRMHPKVEAAGMKATEEAKVQLKAFLDKVGAPKEGDEKRPQAEQIAMIALIAAAAISAEPGFAEEVAEVAEAVQESGGDWFDPIVNFNAGIIAGLDDVLENKIGIPNTFGLAIILYTILIKAITFPLNNSALRSNAMMQLVSPKVKQIQAKYANDKETMNRMMLRLYDDTGINPLGGCLPAIIQLPIFISLYRAINRLAEKDQHFQEPFLWIPNLAGPVAAGQPSLDWLLKSSSSETFVPLIGSWEEAGLYLILPVLLVVSQFLTAKASSPQGEAEGPAAYITGLFPLIIGYTSLVSPAGLGVYWLFNNGLTGLQTQFIRNQLGDEFPEYRKLLDGTMKKEEEEKKRRLEEARNAPAEVKTEGLGVGFGAARAPAPAAAAKEESEDFDEEDLVPEALKKEPVGATITAPRLDRKAAQSRRNKRQSSRRKRR